MHNYYENKYNKIKNWVTAKEKEGRTWDELYNLCVAPDKAESEFNKLKDEELIISEDMYFSEWHSFIDWMKETYSPVISERYGISNDEGNSFTASTKPGSAWKSYKDKLMGIRSDGSIGKPKMSNEDVVNLETSCKWLLNHIKLDTSTIEPVKGLVMGSVQSGKTANMIGLVTMAADNNWNIFIVLTGTIENLRKQTQRRFKNELEHCGALDWHILDHSSKRNLMKDLKNDSDILSKDLKLNEFRNGEIKQSWSRRYVILCLKNSTRLKRLINWLRKGSSLDRMRILVIDDEADQAGVNTANMNDETEEEKQERTKVNQLIIDLVNGNNVENHRRSKNQFQAMNYISFTATPYANVLNESGSLSLYPKDFIYSLKESKGYFGIKAIFGSQYDDRYPGLTANMIRNISDSEIDIMGHIHKGERYYTVPAELKKAVAWFLCAAAILRLKNSKKPISMLIHTTSLQDGHYGEYGLLRQWLRANDDRVREINAGRIIDLCQTVYNNERDKFRKSDLQTNFSEYSGLENVNDEFPDFSVLKPDIEELLSNIVNIEMDDDRNLQYNENAIHLCVDNSRANHIDENGTFLRIVYPTDNQLSQMSKAPVFIVIGGNTLSRGLTLEGLVCTYFARVVRQGDSLMQMARWFGYKFGYELLQRVWMSADAWQKFVILERIDERLKNEFDSFSTTGKSPADFGPRILKSPLIALTSKKKSQHMIDADRDYSGDSYEITDYKDIPADLSHNIEITEKFLKGLGICEKSNAVGNAYLWKNIEYSKVLSEFLKQYIVFDCSPFYKGINDFENWMEKETKNGKYIHWNVAVAGNQTGKNRWRIAGADVGKIKRSKLMSKDFIDIGSLRSGQDVISDIDITKLSPQQMTEFELRKRERKNFIGLRSELGLGDVPLLLLYRIDKGEQTQQANHTAGRRTAIGSAYDIIGMSIIISGDINAQNYSGTVTVAITDRR